MFSNLLNFSYKRGVKEALGFYLAYLFLIILVSVLFAGILGLATGNEDNFGFGLKVGNIIAVITCVAVSLLILKSKNLFGNFLYLCLALLSGVFAYFGGGLLGLIPVSFLSTR